MKLLILILTIMTALLTLGFCGTVKNVVHTVHGGIHGGTWKKKWMWKSKWVKNWKPKTVYVSNWTRVWTPYQTAEYVPTLTIPLPTAHDDWVKSSTHYN